MQAILKKNKYLKNLFFLFLCLGAIYLIATFFEVNPEYIGYLEIALFRLGFLFFLLLFLQIILDTPFAKDFKGEMDIFEDSVKKPFIVFLRKYQFWLFVISYVTYYLATTYYVVDFGLSYFLGVISFIAASLYFTQSAVYLSAYLNLQAKIAGGWKKLVRNMGTIEAKKVAIVCLECSKTFLQLTLGAEGFYKLTHGGMNDISPWRQYMLNRMFPDDPTKIWTESKAAAALHNRAMGNPHQDLYKSPRDYLKDMADPYKDVEYNKPGDILKEAVKRNNPPAK